jgi:dynein heavy chain
LGDPVYEFKNTMPVVTALRSKYLTEEHWKEIKTIMKAEFDINDKEFSLKKLLELKVGDYQEELIDISVRAAQEDSIK